MVRLYRELFRVVRGQWLLIGSALILLSISTSLRLVPPAATKLVIDNVLLGHAPSAGWVAWTGTPGTPKQRLYALVGVVFLVTLVGTLVGLASRWLATLSSKRLQVLMRRRVYEHAVPAAACTGSISSRREGSRVCSGKMPGESASWSSACCSTPGERSSSCWAGWPSWPGSIGAS